jgi:hypothetical protein
LHQALRSGLIDASHARGLLDCTVDQQALNKIILRVAQAEARQSVVLPNQSDGPVFGNDP